MICSRILYSMHVRSESVGNEITYSCRTIPWRFAISWRIWFRLTLWIQLLVNR
jgi:hypothetical protein